MKKKNIKKICDALVMSGCRNTDVLSNHIKKISGWRWKKVRSYMRKYIGF